MCVCVCMHVLWCLLHGQEIVVSLLLFFVCVSSKARLLLQTGNHITIGEAQFKLTYLLEKGEKKTLVHSLCSTNAGLTYSGTGFRRLLQTKLQPSYKSSQNNTSDIMNPVTHLQC